MLYNPSKSDLGNLLVMKKTVAIILNTVILLSLWTGLSSCYCTETDECRSIVKSQSAKCSISVEQSLKSQLSKKDCCSDCFKYSNTNILSESNLDSNPSRAIAFFYTISRLETLTSRKDQSTLVRGPPKSFSPVWKKAFLETVRILI